MEAAQRVGLMVPDSWQPDANDDIAARVLTLTYPVAIKWSDPPQITRTLAVAGIALQKVEYADTPSALLAILQRYGALRQYPLVQSYCPGEGLGQMLMMADGKARLRFQHRRLREYPASGGVSTFCESVAIGEHAGQMEQSERLLREIGWEGPAMVEYRYDRTTGDYWLMEINGRFWGSLPLAHQCGAAFRMGALPCRCAPRRERQPSAIPVSASAVPNPGQPTLGRTNAFG